MNLRIYRNLMLSAITLIVLPNQLSAGSDDQKSQDQAAPGFSFDNSVGIATRSTMPDAWPALSAVDRQLVEQMATEDPLGLLKMCRDRCAKEVRDYSCLFTKRERVNGKLRDQTINRVKYRESPFSVHMFSQGKVESVKRVLYVKGRDRKNGKEQMLVEPAGWLRLLARKIELPLDDRRVLEKNRKTIDQFGFRMTLERLISISEMARKAGDLQMQYQGTSVVNGRPTYTLVRNLPYSGPDCKYPDGLAIIDLDRELLLPISVRCYATSARQQLIATYQVTDLRINEGLGDDAFNF